MATNTTNFGLKKPAYTDTADIADINGNMDKVDVSLNGLADAIAIVANNNTHVAITAGQYVYVHGHGSLAEGLYTAKSNIAANATLSTSNLQADGSGGLNALNSKITFVMETGTTAGTNVTKLNDWSRYNTNGQKNLRIQFQITSSISNQATILNIPTTLMPNGGYASGVAIESNGGTMFPVFISGTTVKACASVTSGYYMLTCSYD